MALHVNMTTISNKLVTNTRDTYASVVRTPSCKEIVRQKKNIDLVNTEGQVLGKPSGRSLSKLIKIQTIQAVLEYLHVYCFNRYF